MAQAPLNIIGGRVRELRERHRLTQEQLTARCQILGLGISRVVLAKIELLTRGVADHEAFTLAKALRVPVADLFPGSAPIIRRKHPNPRGPKVGWKKQAKKAKARGNNARKVR